MSYTALAVVAVLTVVVLDRWVVCTRLTASRAWWTAYGIVVLFQLITNGWLTGRGIVRYAPGTILGSGSVRFLGDGRLGYAPVEDLGFGFALVLWTCVVWTWLGRRTDATEDVR